MADNDYDKAMETQWTPEKEDKLRKAFLDKGIPSDAIEGWIHKQKKEERVFQQKLSAQGRDECTRIANRSIEEKVSEERERFQEDYAPLLPLLQERVDKFAAGKYNERQNYDIDDAVQLTNFPAVDLASGSAIGTVTLAATTIFLPSKSAGLYWYPTDKYVERTKEHLRHLQDETPIFFDGDNKPVFFHCHNTAIELKGLKTTKYNGRNGQLKGPDSSCQDRYVVQFSSDPNDSKSFKKENIFHGGCCTQEDAVIQHLHTKNEAKDFYQGLIDRIQTVDIKVEETWSCIQELYGKCAFVTCSTLLTAIGYRDPAAWKDAMVLASKLLDVDGYFVQYDAVGYENFGDTSIMEDYAKNSNLGFKLDYMTSGTFHKNTGKRRSIIIWKKKDTQVAIEKEKKNDTAAATTAAATADDDNDKTSQKEKETD